MPARHHVESSRSGALSALGPIEEHPDRELGGVVLETVRDAGGDEQEVAGVDAPAAADEHELAGTADDNIDLVARVRLLPTGPALPLLVKAQEFALVMA